jgi:hypothetical protein
MNAKSTNISTSFTADPKNGQMSFIIKFDQLGFVDGSNSQLSFDGGNQGRSLKEGTSQGFQATAKGFFRFQSGV